MRQREAMAILEDRAKQNQRRDIANEIAAENERLKQQERADWIGVSADLLSAAESVLHAWEQSEKHNAANMALWLNGPIGQLYAAVMDFNRKADAATTTTSK